MALRFHSLYKSFTGDQYKIEIWDTDFTGDSTAFNSGDDGFSLRYEGEGGEIETPVLSTSCQIDFYVENATHEALISDIATSQEGRFSVRILFGNSLLDFWHGTVLPDIGSYEEAYYPYVLRISATDGISSLKDVDYNNDGEEYTGKQTMLQHIINCINKLPHINVFYSSSNELVRSYLDWWEERHTHSSSSACLLNQTYIDHAAFITYEKSTPSFKSCYDVISEIMTICGARITCASGVFWIEQISYRTASTVIGRSYSRAGNLLGTSNFSGSNPISQTAAFALEATATYEFVAPVKRHAHTFRSQLRRNFLAGQPEWSESAFIDRTINKPIENNGNSTTLRIFGNINITLSSNTAPGSVMQPFVMVFRVRLKIGSKYLRRPYTLTPGYQIQYGFANWSDPADYAYFAVIIDNGFFLQNSTSATFSFGHVLDFMTPGVQESADNFDFGFSLAGIYNFSGTSISPTDFNISYFLADANLQAYSYGVPVNTEDEREYNCYNDDYPDNTLVTKSEALIGTGIDPNTVGALWVKPSATYLAANLWAEGVEAFGKHIEALLSEKRVGARYVPNRVLNGTLAGNIVAMSRVDWLGQKWILVGGTWDAHNDQFRGEWLELNFAEGLTTSPPIKKIVKLDNTQVPTLPTTGTTGGNTYELTARPPATILTPLSLTNTSTALMLPPGSMSQIVTAIPISEILTDGDLYTGDTIAIINPLSGEWDELTVTATTQNGDTSISVSGSLNSNYPAGSTIFKKPKIGTFNLPLGAGTGDVLVFDGTNWVPMEADGDVSGPYDNLQIKANAVGTNEIANQAVTLAKLATTGAYVGAGIKWDGYNWVIAPVGTVTSVALTMPSIFIVSNSPITGGGTLAVSLQNQSANTFFAGPISGSSTTPAFRLLYLSDIQASGATTGQVIAFDGSNWVPGTITVYTDEQAQDAIGGILANSAEISFSYNDSTPSITALLIATGVVAGTYTKVTVDAKGRVTSATTLSAGDIPNLPASIITSGILPIARGGTGLGALGTALQVLRVNSAGTALEFATLTFSGITGTLTAGRITRASGSSTVTDSDELRWNDTDKALYIGPTSAGAAPASSKLNVMGSGTTSDMYGLFSKTNDAGTLRIKLENIFNAAGGGNVAFWLSVGGANAGDPFLIFSISGVGSWVSGVDNSDSDAFKIQPYDAIGNGALGLQMLRTGELGVSVSPITALTVVWGLTKPMGLPSHTAATRATGNVNANMGWNTSFNMLEVIGPSLGYYKPIVSYGAPTASTLSAIGTGGTVLAQGGSNGVAGHITITTGSSSLGTGAIMRLLLPHSLSSGPFVQLTARNAAAAAQMTNFYIGAASSASSFDIYVATPLAASTTYQLYYRVEG